MPDFRSLGKPSSLSVYMLTGCVCSGLLVAPLQTRPVLAQNEAKVHLESASKF